MEEKKTVIIFTAKKARKLLKEGFTLVDIKPDKTDFEGKQTMQKALLLTVIDVLEAIANDTDIMQSISTEFTTVGAAYKYIEQRIGQIKDKIASIPEPDEEYSCFSLMYTRGDDTPARTPSTGGGGGSCDCEDTTSISNSEIDKWF